MAAIAAALGSLLVYSALCRCAATLKLMAKNQLASAIDTYQVQVEILAHHKAALIRDARPPEASGTADDTQEAFLARMGVRR